MQEIGRKNRLTAFFMLASSVFALAKLDVATASPTSNTAQTDAYSRLIQKGIIRGDPSGAPTAEHALVTRAVYAQLILNAFPAKAKTVGVTGAWPEGPIHSLAALRVVPSVGSFEQAPKQDISRQDAVLIAVKCAQITPNMMQAEIIRRKAAPFSDENDIEPTARSAAHLAVALGLIATTPDGHYGLFRPKDNITMGETSVLIYGLIQH